jgi:hypothetical protein
MPEWSKRAGVQPRVAWQSSQRSELGMWFAVFPVAVLPLWQETQLPVMPE